MPQGGVDLTLTVGSTTYDLMVARDDKGNALFKRFPAPPLNPVVNQTGIIDYAAQNPVEGITRDIDDFSQGCGAFIYDPINDPGRYALGENVDTRWGYAIPGPREVADLTGLDTGYMPIKRILHGNVNWLLTTNGTHTKVYRVEAGAWSNPAKLTVNNVIGTDLVSFANVVAVALGGSTAYQFSSDNGATWTASTKAGNAKYANYFCVAQYGQLLPKVWYVRDPADLYATADLTNTGVSSGPTTIGDSSNDEFNSLVRDASTNLLLMGKRHLLFTVDSAGVVTVVAGPYRYVTTSDDGSGAAAPNFKDPVVIQNRIYYRVEDYRLIEVSGGVVTENLQPGASGPQVPRMQLPINGMTAINGELWVAIGTNQVSTIRDLVNIIPTILVINSFTNVSELYVGRYQNDSHGNLVWRWHGIILKSTINVIRYMWYDDASNYLYMAKRYTTNQATQTRALVTLTNPLAVLTSGTVYLSLATWKLEMGLDNTQVSIDKTLRKGFARTGLLGTTPTIALLYRTANDDVNDGYSTLVTYTSAATARTGTSFSASATYRGVRYQFQGAPVSTAATMADYAVLYSAQFVYLFYPPVMDMFQFTIKATNGQMNLTGAAGAMSWKAVRDAIDAMKDATTPATLNDVETGDSWTVRMEPNGGMEENGLGDQRSITVTLHEVV